MESGESTQAKQTPVRIRTMRLGDLPEVAALEKRCFNDPWSLALFRAEVEDRDANFPRLAILDDELAGYSIAWFAADEVHLGNIAVSPEHRGHGIARALLEDLLEEAKLRGSSYVVLEVRESNESAIRLYRRYGFKEVAIRRGYYEDTRENALIMMLHLTGEDDENE